MNKQAHTTDELQKNIGEIKMAIRMQLVCSAIVGDSLREFVNAGFSLQEIADKGGDHLAVLKVKIDLSDRLNALMKAPESSLAEALDTLCNEGWLDRLDSADDTGDEL